MREKEENGIYPLYFMSAIIRERERERERGGARKEIGEMRERKEDRLGI